MSDSKLSCFVIMPFGEKTDTDGKWINFDVIYRYIIFEAVEELKEKNEFNIDCVRCDAIEEAGSITTDMFGRILRSDAAVVDITSMNPNVFYELGVRHALRECVTVLIRRKVSKLPFNIQGLRVIDYDPSDITSFDKAKHEIQNFIRNGLNNKRIDSPVREILPDLKTTFSTSPLPSGKIYPWILRMKPDKTLALVTGDLKRLHGIAEIWVNSENTHMQMARYHDQSVSGLIRYLGATKENGEVQDDLIGNDLDAKLNRVSKAKHNRDRKIISCQPGSVVVTTSGKLAEAPYKVKQIFHVATVRGVPGGGYEPVPNIEDCVWEALREADRQPGTSPLRSILFPIFGTGTARGDFKKNAKRMIHAALNYFETNESQLEVAYFLAYDQDQLTAALDIMGALTLEGSEERLVLARQTTPFTAQNARGAKMSKKVEILSEKEVFNKTILRIREARLRCQRYDGTMGDEIVRLSLERGDSAAALVHDTDDDVVIMTEQFRYPAYEKGPAWIQELPAGTVDDGESPADAMTREIREEIGYTISALRHIGTFYVSPGGTSERIHLYYTKVDAAVRASSGGGLRGEGEDIRVIRVPVAEALAQLQSGRIVDAKTIIGLQWLALHRNAVQD